MKQFFSESYSKICVEADREQLELRWKGVEEYCKQKDFDVYELVKLYYLLKTDEKFSQEFVSIFHNIDMSFNRNNTRELSVLAGTILLCLLEKPGLRLYVIFPVICLSRYNIDVVLSGIIEKAYKCLGEMSAEIRERVITYKNVPTKTFKEYCTSLKSLEEMDVEQIKGLAGVCNAIESSISLLIYNQEEMKKSIEIYHEDSNILSWICGEWSNDLDMPLTKRINQRQVALNLAKELAELVVVMPGPYPAKSFLKKMLDMCKADAKEYSLVEMVDGIENGMKQKIVEQYKCISETPESTPILFSIKTAMDVNKPEVWQHTISSHVGFDVNYVKNSILDWAEMMYYECMLIKADCE